MLVLPESRHDGVVVWKPRKHICVVVECPSERPWALFRAVLEALEFAWSIKPVDEANRVEVETISVVGISI